MHFNLQGLLGIHCDMEMKPSVLFIVIGHFYWNIFQHLFNSKFMHWNKSFCFAKFFQKWIRFGTLSVKDFKQVIFFNFVNGSYRSWVFFYSENAFLLNFPIKILDYNGFHWKRPCCNKYRAICVLFGWLDWIMCGKSDLCIGR